MKKKKDLSLLLEKLCNCQSQDAYVSGPAVTPGKGIKSFTGLPGLNTRLTSACFVHGTEFIDNFNIFGDCKDFKHDGVHPNITGSRRLGANLRHALGMPQTDRQPAPPTPSGCIQSDRPSFELSISNHHCVFLTPT